jgi:hypothetical protein
MNVVLEPATEEAIAELPAATEVENVFVAA